LAKQFQRRRLLEIAEGRRRRREGYIMIIMKNVML
jgi:hypothetical protein